MALDVSRGSDGGVIDVVCAWVYLFVWKRLVFFVGEREKNMPSRKGGTHPAIKKQTIDVCVATLCNIGTLPFIHTDEAALLLYLCVN